MRLPLISVLTLFLMPLAHGQTPLTWDAAGGLLPTELVPEWSIYFGTGCNATGVTLGAGTLTLDNSSPCPDDVVVYAQMHDGPDGSIPAVYFIEARCRVVQSAQVDPARGVALLALAPPSFCPWSLEVDDGEVLLSWMGQPLGSAALDTTSALRTYRLEVAYATLSSRVLVDGQVVVNAGTPNLNTCTTNGAWNQFVAFGNGSPVEAGVAEWQSVTHNMGDGEEQFCTSGNTPNSLGWTATLTSSGSRSVAQNDLVLRSAGLQPGSFGYYLGSRTFGPPTPLVGGQGTLCLGGAIGRFNGPGQVLMASSRGVVTLPIDLTRLPQPGGPVAAQPGESWHFQLWYRDSNPGPTSNTSWALQIFLE